MVLVSYTSKAQLENKIILGNIDSIDSKILQEKRKIWVYVPNSASDGLYALAKYPVVYLLDGNAHFYSVVGMIQQLSSVNGNMICPEMIVVGIPNTDRMRDLTPSHVDIDPMMNDSNAVRTSGGGERFASFLEKELMPYIEKTYPTLPYRTLIGHSLGGLTVTNLFLNHKDLFNAYIAIDPSMWWDNQKLLSKAGGLLAQQDYKGKKLFLGIANTMNPGMDTVKVKRDTSPQTQHIRSILTMNNLLQKNKKNGLAYNYKYYSSDSHGSVPLIATYDALHFIFKFYDLRFKDEDYSKFSRNTITKVENHFKEVSKQFGFNVPVPEMIVNQLGYLAMSQKKMDEAEYLFKSNVSNFPVSFNVHDSLGDFYAAKGEKKRAIESYQKALTIKEFQDTRSKLEVLLK
ncbi:periplasmic siderophore cleavage esterase IroE family protein [Adhaeribacter aerolatus]|uniref:Periplasmic siderophore cleavage esterase IroE family protein n=1 Tax=Adhaeribacter aerolatus TaxID=670289 RepID=A0A512AYY0_9BACT|nr:periplasmic siderophore cleavage esterase IroE family protein [Adhaeribacter aerolatus]